MRRPRRSLKAIIPILSIAVIIIAAALLSRDDCARLSNTRTGELIAAKPLCYMKRARTTGNVRHCLKIDARATGYMTDECVRDMAVVKGDTELCSLLEDGDRIQRCIAGAQRGNITNL